MSSLFHSSINLQKSKKDFNFKTNLSDCPNVDLLRADLLAPGPDAAARAINPCTFRSHALGGGTFQFLAVWSWP